MASSLWPKFEADREKTEKSWSLRWTTVSLNVQYHRIDFWFNQNWLDFYTGLWYNMQCDIVLTLLITSHCRLWSFGHLSWKGDINLGVGKCNTLLVIRVFAPNLYYLELWAESWDQIMTGCKQMNGCIIVSITNRVVKTSIFAVLEEKCNNL